MYTAICRIEIYIPGVRSLKDKRQVVKSLISRLKNRNISIIETGDNDLLQKARIGFAIVRNRRAHVEEASSKALDFIEDNYNVQLLEAEIEII